MPVSLSIKFLNVFRQNNIEFQYGPFSINLPWHSILHGCPRYFKECVPWYHVMILFDFFFVSDSSASLVNCTQPIQNVFPERG